MSAANFTYYMDIELPSVGTSLDYIDLINRAYTIIDTHDHNTFLLTGKQLSELSVNWTSINLTGFNITNAFSLQFTPRLPLNTLRQIIYFQFNAGIDLWYTDGAGNPIRITKSQNVNAVATAAGFKGDFSPYQATAVYTLSTFTYSFNIEGGFANIHGSIIKPMTSMVGRNFTYTTLSSLIVTTPTFYTPDSKLLCTQGASNVAFSAVSQSTPRLIQNVNQLMNKTITAGMKHNRFDYGEASGNTDISNNVLRTRSPRIKTFNTVYPGGGTTYQNMRNFQNGGADVIGNANTPVDFTSGGITACVPTAVPGKNKVQVTAQAYFNASLPYTNPLMGSANKMIHMSIVFVDKTYNPVISDVEECHQFNSQTNTGSMQYTMYCEFTLTDTKTGLTIPPDPLKYYCVLRI